VNDDSEIRKTEEGRDLSEDLGVDGTIILKCIQRI
jgi:hypothetical protein